MLNNPIRYIDPTGHAKDEDGDGIGDPGGGPGGGGKGGPGGSGVGPGGSSSTGSNFTKAAQESMARLRVGESGTKKPSWQAYETKYGTTKFRMQVEYKGKTKTIIPDFSTPYYHIDYKNYDFSKSSYERPFIQEQVIKDFTTQAEMYLSTGEPVIFQFSRPPSQWLIDVLDSLLLDADVFFFVAP